MLLVQMSDPPPSASPAEFAERQRRTRELLEKRGARGVVIGRRDNFSWATAGGDGVLQLTSERAVAFLVVTPERTVLVSYAMDSDRLMEEQLAGLDIQPAVMRWPDGDLGAHAVQLAGSDEGTVLADVPLPGSELVALHSLHHPLTTLDRLRLRWLGQLVDQVVADVAGTLRPGMAEREVAADMGARFMSAGVTPHELMVGVDDRIRRYRHPVPTHAQLHRYALLHPTVSRWGLHAITTRSVHFGSPPKELRRRIDACGEVEAVSVLASRPGRTFGDVHQLRVDRYAELGHPGEETAHFQGGVTGYLLYDPAHVTRPEASITDGMALDWFVSIRGAKTEDTILVESDETTVLTATGAWPLVPRGSDGSQVRLPELLIL